MEDAELFAGTSGPHNASIAIVGESWGSYETEKKGPLVGPSGQLNDQLLARAGISRLEVFCTNVCSRQPPGNRMEHFYYPTTEAKARGQVPTRGLYPREETKADIQRLYLQLDRVRPKVIIAYGNWALWALCYGAGKVDNGKRPFLGTKVAGGIGSWRGSQLFWNTGLNGHIPRIPVIPTYHPAAALRNEEWRHVILHDITFRARRIAHGTLSNEPPQYDFTLRPTLQQIINWLDDTRSSGVRRLAVDIETRGGHTACICFASSSTRAISIPLMCVENPTGYFTAQQEVTLHRILRTVLAYNSGFEIVGQNYSYDMQYLRNLLLISPRIDLDTMVLQHLSWPGQPASLAYIASMYSRYYSYWKDEGKDWVEGIPEDNLWKYNCLDGVYTWECSYHLEKVLKQLNLSHFIAEEMDVLRLQYEMMTFGVAIDRQARDEMANDLQQELENFEDYFEGVLNPAIIPELQGKTKSKSAWYSSPAQLGRLFYDVLGLPEKFNRDTGARKADDDALQQLKIDEPILRPLLNKLQDYRSTGIFYNNVTSALEPDGRMATQYTQMPNTFRWSSKKNVFGRGMNLQNVPKGQED